MIAKATDKGIRIRFPAPIRKKLKEAARRNGRSFNSEVLVRVAMASK